MNKTLKDLSQTVKCDARYGAKSEPTDDWQSSAHGYSVTLVYRRRRMTVDFWMGSAHTDEPNAVDMLDCLLSDSSVSEQSFSEFCSDFGYDEDSRRAARIYKQCQSISKRVHRLLGDDYEMFMDAERNSRCQALSARR